jgi:hypothetical protein
MIVQTGQGGSFPATSVQNVAQLTLVAVDGTHEIVACTSRTGDNFVIQRGQEGTPAGTFPAGSRVELRLTAATLNSFLQKTGGQMLGPVDFNYQRNTNFLSTNAHIDYLAIRAIFGADANGNAALQFPGGGAFPQINGSKLLTWVYLAQLIMIYYGGIEFLPPHLKICDGTRGTPDLRDRFVICAGPGHPQFTGGGDFSLYIAPNGGHNHGGGVNGTQLEPAHLPPLNPLSKAFAETTWAPGDYPAPANKRVFLVNTDNQGYTSVGAHHGHTIAGGTNWHLDGAHGHHGHTGSYHPPYYSLYYVMLEEGAFN